MQERKRERLFKIFTSRYFFVVAVFALFFLSMGVVKKMAREYTVQAEIERLEAEVMALERAENEFSRAVSYLESDHFVEDEARGKFGMRKAGESVIVITGEEKKPTADTLRDEMLRVQETHTQASEQKTNNFQAWWNYFFKS